MVLDETRRHARRVAAFLNRFVALFPEGERVAVRPTREAEGRVEVHWVEGGAGLEERRRFEADLLARRLLAGGVTTRRTPDATSRWFDATADAILASVRAAESAAGPQRGKEFDATVTDLKILAQLARFHARRSLAAVHYNLFLRGRRLAELYAATLDTKTALDTWSELVALLGTRETVTFGHPALTLRGAWGAELIRLEFDYRDLEAMCCPPDESWLHEKVWSPSRNEDALTKKPSAPETNTGPPPR